jgi:ABC-type polysaccharide/polyol phosphate export permease
MIKALIQPETSSGVFRGYSFVRHAMHGARASFKWAFLDVVCQYRRSRIGPFWETISLAVTVTGLTFVMGALFGGDPSGQVAYIGLGLMVWSFLSSSIMDGCIVFVANANNIRDTKIPLNIYIGRTVFKAFIVFSHQIILVVIALVAGFVVLDVVNILALLGVLILLMNAFWVAIFLGFLSARFRDVEMIMKNVMQLSFLMTPVFWDDSRVGAAQRFMVDWNPFYHLIAIVRMPMLGEVPSEQSYIIVSGLLVVGLISSLIVYKRYRGYISFFV